MRKKIIYTVILFLLFTGFLVVYYVTNSQKKEEEIQNDKSDFTTTIINKTFKSENYLISPYSIEMALNMLKLGAKNDTRDEIEKVVGSRELNILNKNVKIANSLFIKNTYDSIIENDFKNILSEKYNSEILYDKFETPEIINDWVNKHTDGMIEKILNSISPTFVLGLANAIAIDAKWNSQFECENTTSEKFNMLPGKSLNVEMMHNTYESDAKYLINDEMKSVSLPYKEDLEFIAILPNQNIESYISKLNINELNNKIDKFEEASYKKRLILSIPRFSYSYDLINFKNILINMGIKNAFDSEKADFTSIITKENMNRLDIDNIYVSDAIHKTYIDLNEKGTKAAAVTYFGLRASGISTEKYKEIKIEFNKPFIYMIRDNKSKEVLFFGSVYKPSEWNGSTCKKLDD